MAATKITRTNNGGTPVGDVTPEEAAAIRAGVAGREQAPSTRDQAIFSNWRQIADQLGDPFEVERIPVSKLRAMRRDPMLGFGLSFIKTPHVRAKWFINAKDNNGPNAQISAHLDQDLRRIYASYVLQHFNSLDFGFQALVKRFELRTPTGTFVETNPETGEQQESPIWSQGSVQPIGWKPFVALPPENVDPIWSGQGDFNGINFSTGSNAGAPAGGQAGGAAGRGGAKGFKIDVYHSLWITNERDQNFGSLFGYPRLGYSYRFWWSYWFRWAIADRAFERKADPSIIIRHPDGDIEDPITGEPISAGEYALSMGERMRSGGVIALPSEMWEDANGRGTSPKWDVDFTKEATNFDPFDKSFDYLDVQKLRCITGDTPIDCPRDYKKYPDGIPISELREGQLIWCFNEKTEEFELRPVQKVGKTRPNAELLKLTLDTGKTIRATPDHKFLMRDGVWRELQHLKPGDSLMPLEHDFEPFVRTRPNERGWLRKPREGREMDLVAEAAYGSKEPGIHIHHFDDRHGNTSPENLRYLTNSEHTRLTNTGKRRPPGHFDRVKAGLANRICQACSQEFSPAGPTSKRCAECQAQYRFDTASELSRSRWEGKRAVALRPKACQDCGIQYQPVGAAQKWCDSCRAENWREESKKGDPVSQEEWMAGLTNHKVASIEPCEEREDTWDLSVDGPTECHNFVSQEVVLHNSLFIPEQAFLEGKGGSSSRNVAAEMSNSFTESQAVLAAQISEHINRWMIPQWLAVNYPEFVAAGGTAQFVMQGFADEDVAFTTQIIQLVGQQDTGAREILKLVDLKKVLEDAGTPIASFAEQKRREEKIVEDQQSLIGPTAPIAPIPGQQVGVAPSPTGFSYVQPRELIYLSDTSNKFIESLPSTPHYEDQTIKSLARQMWSTYRDLYRDEYETAISAIEESEDSLVASDDSVELAGVIERATEVIKEWTGSAKWPTVLERTLGIFSKIAKRASNLELKRANLSAKLDETETEDWLRDHVAQFASKVAETTRTEVRDFIARQISEGVTDRKEIAQNAREHFSDWPDWKSDRLARTEVRDVYNAATLMAARQAGVKQVQAIDALVQTSSDPDCRARNGRIFKVEDAFNETEHPNGTLGWRIVPVELTIERRPGVEKVRFDDGTITFSDQMDPEAEGRILLTVVDSLRES